MAIANHPNALTMLTAAPIMQDVQIVPATPPALPQTATPHIVAGHGQIEALAGQLASLELQRVDMLGEIRSGDAAARTAAQSQLRVLDAQIEQTKASLKSASRTLAAEQGQVIVAPQPPFIYRNGPDAHDIEVMVLFAMAFVILLPIVIGIGRRIGRKGAPASPPMPDNVSPRLDRMEQAIDAIAIEVERISESQRFIAKVLAERGETPAISAHV